MILVRRRVLLLLGFAALAVYLWLAVQVYRAQRDPEGFRAWDGPFAWIVGPSGSNLSRAAARHVDEALAVLEDPSQPPATRLESYRAHLAAAERLQVRSLRAQPAQALGIARLAAVRWELGAPFTEEEAERQIELIDLAARMAPRDPAVQIELGRLLLIMGRQDQALGQIRFTLDLEPATARDAVDLLADFLFAAEEIYEVLPRIPEVLVALGEPFRREGRHGEYAEILDANLDSVRPSAPLLASYGGACLRTGRARRLLDRMNALGPFDDPVLESERLAQRAGAALKLGLPADALEDARRARTLQPDSPRFDEHLGNVALAAGEPDEALTAFRLALRKVARGSAGEGWRARLYSRIGRALDARGDPDRAYDAYRRALDLDPNEAHARRRVDEMEASAGVRRLP